MGPPPIPQAFLMGRITQAAQPRGVGSVAYLGQPVNRDLLRASGLQAATEPGTPLMGWPSYSQQILKARRPYFAADAGGSAFNEFFGLTPAEETPLAAEGPGAAKGLTELLAQQNDQSIRRIEARAIEIFKLATAGREDSGELLSRARWALCVARDMDPRTRVSPVLLIHAALQQNQPLSAVGYLFDAVERNPDLFVEWPDLASYFGDPQILETQARMYLRAGDQRPSPAACALQAYCAWVLGDQTRVRQALSQLVDSEGEGQSDAGLETFRYALAAALK